MVNLVNLTPHPINLGDRVIQPSGIVARTTEVKEDPILVSGGIVLQRIFPGKIEGLPENPEPSTFYIVSREVAQAAHLPHVVSPYDYVRDDQGRIIGCKSLAWFPPQECKVQDLE
jgi:hypothetical protein